MLTFLLIIKPERVKNIVHTVRNLNKDFHYQSVNIEW